MVEFGPDTSYGRNTAWYPVSAGLQQTNILVAGMRASTTYHMRSQVQCADGSNPSTGADMTFTTGALPSLPFPALTVTRPNPSLSPTENPGIEMLTMTESSIPAFFTDRDANVIWYYDVGQNNFPYTFKLLPNGDMILNIALPNGTGSILREVDLAGNVIREMDVTALATAMQAAGFDFSPTLIHHDLLPLDNGHLLLLTQFPKSFTNLTGYPGTTNVLGDGIVDLDPNWNPVWAWNAFDYLDVNRHLNGLPDWTHSNALIYSATDGNLLLSMRHQSWVLKIDYNNGAGAGDVIWKLGYQGDFSLAQGDDPSLWFSFQHFPSIVAQGGTQTTLAIWDNGDNRVLDTSGTICGSVPPATPCYSRATKFQIDEGAMVANLLWTDTPGFFGVWGGSINELGNGNVEYDANAITTTSLPPASEVMEVTQTSTPEVVWQMTVPVPDNAYRGYRVPSLYPGVAWQY
jgi:arylsulfate sulfotransferase